MIRELQLFSVHIQCVMISWWSAFDQKYSLHICICSCTLGFLLISEFLNKSYHWLHVYMHVLAFHFNMTGVTPTQTQQAVFAFPDQTYENWTVLFVVLWSIPAKYICNVHGPSVLWWMVCRKLCSKFLFCSSTSSFFVLCQ